MSSAAAPAQTPLYRIIFIHGLISSDHTCEETIGFMRDAFGWDDPFANDEQGVFHALLNASGLSTHYGMDVRVDFPYEHNDLYDGHIYAMNFKNWWDPATGELKPHENRSLIQNQNYSESNESAIVKQGYALGLMIRKVLDITGASKVILVGHAMGGLAAREYLQRRDSSGNPMWWAFPGEADGHRIAKLITTGTPHAGSNMTEFGGIVGINEKSEAARDLTYYYYTFGPPNFSSNPDHGVYLFGGAESIIPGNQWPDASVGYLNTDVDCNGNTIVVVFGLNSNTIIRRDNSAMPLPPSTDYTWIVSDITGVNGEGVVRKDRQYLDSRGDTLEISKNHLAETGDARSILRGLDEPDPQELAYTIALNHDSHFFSNIQMGGGTADYDWFAFTIKEQARLFIDLSDLPTRGTDVTVHFSLYRKEDLSTKIVSGTNANGASSIRVTTDALLPGDFFAANSLGSQAADHLGQRPAVHPVARIQACADLAVLPAEQRQGRAVPSDGQERCELPSSLPFTGDCRIRRVLQHCQV